jgi:hypothetical protein
MRQPLRVEESGFIGGRALFVDQAAEHVVLRIPAKPPAYSRINSPTDSDIISPMDSGVIPPGLPGFAGSRT